MLKRRQRAGERTMEEADEGVARVIRRPLEPSED